MNQIHILVNRPRRGALRMLREPSPRRKALLGALVLALALPPGARANPSGGVVVHGDARFQGGAGSLSIRQGSQRAIIDWNDFSIQRGETTRFIQPGSSAAILNRVTGDNPSEIHGRLKANGNVFVINPNGILVGPSGRIDVHGLVLSTLDPGNASFLAGEDLVFKGASGAGVVNYGSIDAIGGDVFLIGRTVRNVGSIRATGSVGLAAGREVLLTTGETATGERIFVRAGGNGASLQNDGTLQGAAVELKAHGNVYALAINNKGSIRATGTSTRGGRVFLNAADGSASSSGSIRATAPAVGNSAQVLIAAAYAKVDGLIRAEGGGKIRVSAAETASVGGVLDASSAVGAGGSVVVEGRSVEVGPGATLDASGVSGGSVRIGGGFQGGDPAVRNASSTSIAADSVLKADATGSGNAGTVVVWSDDRTDFLGTISAEAKGGGFGGRVEVSGRRELLFDGRVSTLSAEAGRNGSLLLDPTDFQIVASGAGANRITAANLVSLLGGGNVVVSTLDPGGIDSGQAGDILVNPNANVVWNNANSLTLLAHRHIQVNANIQNAGEGGVHLVAGWDGFTNAPGSAGAFSAGGALRADSFAEGTYGNGGGSVYIGNTDLAQRVSVGSKGGDTQVAAYDLVLQSRTATPNTGHRNAQLGFFDGSNPGSASGTVHAGDIWVSVSNDIQVLAGGNGRGWAQIGHGGNDESNLGGSSYTGSITLQAGRDILVHAPEIVNGGFRSYAQIGHGGAGNVGQHGGDILVAAGRDVHLKGANGGNWAYAQIGHGGVETGGSFTGTIEVSALNQVRLDGSRAANSYLQIGHGGQNSTAAVDGIIRVVAGEAGIAAVAGSAAANYVQIGHGGLQSNAASFSGLIEVRSVGDIRFDRNLGNSDNAYAQIGHGGSGSIGLKSGGVSVVSSQGDVLFGTDTSRTGRGAVQIGHGGRAGSGDTSGSVEVEASTGDIRFHGVFADANANHREGYAQIGHGGRGNQGDHGVVGDAIRVRAGGALEFLGGSSAGAPNGNNGREAYAQIGHGGYQSNGNHAGDLFVTAGDILFDTRGASGDRSYVQIGHGGYFSSGDFLGDISVSATGEGGGIRFLAGRTASYAQLGHGGRNDHGSANDNSGPETVRIASNPDYAPGTISGNIDVTASGDIVFTGGFQAGGTGFAQIGHGGYHQDARAGEGHFGNIAVTSVGGAIVFTAGDRNAQHAQIGHGGYESFGNHGGAILVEAATGISLMAGGGTLDNNPASFAKIGHGGYDADFAPARNIAQIGVVNGNGGFNPAVPLAQPGALSGSVTVRTTFDGADVVLVGSQAGGGFGQRGFAQIGHGGMFTDGEISGDIVVASGGAVLLERGRADDSYVQIGHGGRTTAGSIADAAVSVSSGHGGNIVLGGEGEPGTGFSALRTYAQIGHGGFAHSGARSGAIGIDASGSLTLAAGAAFAHAYAQIGHGGSNAAGDASGEIRIGASGDLTATGSTVVTSAAFVGHGGVVNANNLTAGSREGSLLVSVGGLTRLQSATARAFLGHLGASPVSGDSRLALVTGQLDLSGIAGGLGAVIAPFVQRGSVDIGITAGDLVIEGPAIASPGHRLAFFASGDVMIATRVQSDGPGSVSVVAGWDGSTGLVGGSGLSLDAELVRFVPGAFGAGGAVAQIGDGTQTQAASLGSRLGDTIVLGDRVEIAGGQTGAERSARVGYDGGGTGPISGAILLGYHGGGLELRGGAGEGAFAQIGHGVTSGGFDITSTIRLGGGNLSDVRLLGGDGDGSHAFLGHGGLQYRGDLSGDIKFDASIGELFLVGGGGSNSFAQIGHGGIAFAGRISGHLDISAIFIDLIGGAGNSASARIGHGGRAGLGDVSGELHIAADRGIRLAGGAGSASATQIGHGGIGYRGSSIQGGIELVSGADLLLRGGGGLQSAAQIGHGGGGSGGGTLSGSIVARSLGDLVLESGMGGASFAQIGHGGARSIAWQQGDVAVLAVGSGRLRSINASVASYAKIGHGDHVLGQVSSASGGGEGEGDLSISFGRSLELFGGAIGHGRSGLTPSAFGGTVQIAVAASRPTDPSGGYLLADRQAEIYGPEGLRLYLPGRASNRIAAGALLNGVAWRGLGSPLTFAQRPDEFVIHVVGDLRLSPNQHTNLLGSGPAPSNGAVYAFYYDTIEVRALSPGIGGPPSIGELPSGLTPERPQRIDPIAAVRRLVDDANLEGWSRSHVGRHTKPGTTEIRYEGFRQYGPDGEVSETIIEDNDLVISPSLVGE
jgi:filamentous hemagglutinin family protein